MLNSLVRINHPKFGEMLSSIEAAECLGIPRRKFRRLGLPPQHIEGYTPVWSRRILDRISTGDGFQREEVLKKGRECAAYLMGEMDEEEIVAFQKVIQAPSFAHDGFAKTLAKYGIPIRFRSVYEAILYQQGIAVAI